MPGNMFSPTTLGLSEGFRVSIWIHRKSGLSLVRLLASLALQTNSKKYLHRMPVYPPYDLVMVLVCSRVMPVQSWQSIPCHLCACQTPSAQNLKFRNPLNPKPRALNAWLGSTKPSNYRYSNSHKQGDFPK